MGMIAESPTCQMCNVFVLVAHSILYAVVFAYAV